MTEAEVDAEPSVVSPIDRAWLLVRLAVAVGAVASTAGVIVGIVLVTDRTGTVRCPPGKIFQNGAADTNCYAHDNAVIGVGVLSLSLAMAAVLVVTGFVAWVVLTKPGADSVDPSI